VPHGAPQNRLSSSELLWVALMLAGGAWFRFKGLDAGIPFDLGSDEPHVMERSVRILKTGDFNPHFFDYPGLYIYLQAIVGAARFLLGAMDGLWRSLDDVSAANFYLWGRGLTATFGVATIAVTWRLGRRIDRLSGLVAALLLAVQPIHVRESHFVLTDVPMTFFVALTLLAAVRAVERPSPRAWATAGAAAGLAAATKYTGAVVLIVPLVALLVARLSSFDRLRQGAVVVVCAAGAFLLCAPYTVLDPAGFLNGFAALASAHAQGPPPAAPAWWTYVRHLQMNLGHAGFVAALASIGVAAVRAARSGSSQTRAIWICCAVFVLVFYTVIAGQTLVYARYLLPLLPPLLVITGATVALLYRRLSTLRAWGWRWSAVVAIVLAALVAGPPAARAHGWVTARAQHSTHRLAYDWILAHVPRTARVAIETTMNLPSPYYTHHVRRLTDEPPEAYAAEGIEYFVVAIPMPGDGGAPPAARVRPYPDLLGGARLLEVFPPTADHSGPLIQIYQRGR
jgi:4-amino-4-deoxy-L-arabinose transferase-like glycosyltransferase